MPRMLFQKPHGANRGPDVVNFSWAEYGLRCGMPRLLKLFEKRGIPVTTAFNAAVIDVYPDLANAIREARWEFMGHGMVQRSLELEDDELAVIRASLDKLQAFTGRRPRSWLGPGLGETLATPDHLAAEGIEFIFEWALDDLPQRMQVRQGEAFAMPYALELNDVLVFAIEKHESRVFFERFRDSVDALGPELREQPRVLTLALHPHIIAQPHRLPWLERTLDMLQKREDTVFMTCDAIGDWYKAASAGDQ